MNRLCTFVQVSDLHFGGSLARHGFDPWGRYVPLLNGFVGHDKATLRYVQQALTRLRRSEPNVRLLVTGDVTAFGARAQFDEAHQFIGNISPTSPFVGLNEKSWRAWSIPGNHDQWPGVPFFSLGGPNSTVQGYFPATPPAPVQSLGNGKEIEFLRLNSDANVRPWSPERLYACGSFVQELQALEANLGQPQPNRVRVLLLHHSYEFQGKTVPRTRWVPVAVQLQHLTIDDASRRALEGFVLRQDIRVLLTGHVHCPHYIGTPPGLLASGARKVLEARCGSTTQRLAAGASSSGRVQNTLIVHRVLEVGSDTFWETEVHHLSLGGGVGFLQQPSSRVRLRLWP